MNDLNRIQDDERNSEGLQLVEYPGGRSRESVISDQSSVVDSIVESYYGQFRWIQVDEQTNLYTNMFQAVVQIMIMFACVISDEKFEMKSDIQAREEAWIDLTLKLFTVCLLGFIIILCVTRKDRRTSRSYVIKMIGFMILQSVLLLLIFMHFIDGLDMRYGHEFSRKIFAYDPTAHEYKFVLNASKVKVGNVTGTELVT